MLNGKEKSVAPLLKKNLQSMLELKELDPLFGLRSGDCPKLKGQDFDIHSYLKKIPPNQTDLIF